MNRKPFPNKFAAYAMMRSIKESILLFLSASICIIVIVLRIGWRNRKIVPFVRRKLSWMSFTSRKIHRIIK